MAKSDQKKEQPDPMNTESGISREASSGKAARNPLNASAEDGSVNMEFVLDIPLEVTVELGRTKMLINDMLKLGQGSVIELTKLAGESLDILANQKPIARGEVVVVNEKYGVRLTEVISPMERIERLR
jgi:flagellar motor switch protein FliN/FliY